MRIPLISDARKMREAVRRRSPEHRDDSGLTTLEWLLIVAAVAGLAALAVVLVQNVVGETSEQIAGSSARKTAATIAADEIMRDASRNAADQPQDAKEFDDWESYYTSRCNRLEITYGDAGIKTSAKFKYDSSGGSEKANDSVTASAIKIHPPDGGTGTGYNTDGLADDPSMSGEAVAHCVVGDA